MIGTGARTGRRRAAALALGLAGLLALAGCGAGDDAAPPAAADEGSTVETAFGPVTVPADPQRVVALGWGDAETALSLGVQVVATRDWQSFGGNGVGPWAADLVTRDVELLDTAELDVERVAALQPDLVLNTRAAASQEEHDLLSRIAPTVHAPAGTPAFGTDWRTQVRTVAAALGRQDAGESVVRDLESRITAAADAHPEFAGRTAVAAASFSGQFGAYLPGDGRLDLLTDLGFVARPDLAGLPAQGFYAEVSAERADLLDADVTVLFPLDGTAEALAADPVVAALPAARDGRLVVLDPADEVTAAFSTASPPALGVALDGLVPRLAAAAARLG